MSLPPELTRDVAVAPYTRLLESGNARDADAFATQFASTGSTVGFDASPLDVVDADSIAEQRPTP